VKAYRFFSKNKAKNDWRSKKSACFAGAGSRLLSRDESGSVKKLL
jgi:hypothetical protein